MEPLLTAKGIVSGLVRPNFSRQLLIAPQPLRQHRSSVLRTQGHLSAGPAAKSIRSRRYYQISKPAHRLQEAIIHSHRPQVNPPTLQIRAEPLQARYVSEVLSIQQIMG